MTDDIEDRNDSITGDDPVEADEARAAAIAAANKEIDIARAYVALERDVEALNARVAALEHLAVETMPTPGTDVDKRLAKIEKRLADGGH